jgi:F0F1-type ATP synthase gamma subunit
VAYTDFISALTQKPNVKQILPISENIFKEKFVDMINLEH